MIKDTYSQTNKEENETKENIESQKQCKCILCDKIIILNQYSYYEDYYIEGGGLLCRECFNKIYY